MPSKKLNAIIGFVSIPMRLDKATQSGDDKTHTVCLGGRDGAPAHDPVRVRQYVECPTCTHSASSHYGFPDRAVERGDELVVLSKEDLEAAAGAPIKDMHLEFHPREKVYAATLPSGSVNNLRPDQGGEKQYALLLETLRKRTDVVAVAVWAHVSKNQLWVVEVVEDRLVASSRCWPEDVRVAPEIAAPSEEIPDVERAMFEQIVDLKVGDFDLGQYVDTARHGIRELVGNTKGIPMQADGTTPALAGSLLAALEATLAEAKPVPKQRTAKKTAKKKTAA